jgi:hypothetical protein
VVTLLIAGDPHMPVPFSVSWGICEPRMIGPI